MEEGRRMRWHSIVFLFLLAVTFNFRNCLVYAETVIISEKVKNSPQIIVAEYMDDAGDRYDKTVGRYKVLNFLKKYKYGDFKLGDVILVGYPPDIEQKKETIELNSLWILFVFHGNNTGAGVKLYSASTEDRLPANEENLRAIDEVLKYTDTLHSKSCNELLKLHAEEEANFDRSCVTNNDCGRTHPSWGCGFDCMNINNNEDKARIIGGALVSKDCIPIHECMASSQEGRCECINNICQRKE